MVTMQTRIYPLSPKLLWAKLFFIGILVSFSVSGPARCAAQTVEPTEIIHIDSDLVDLKVSIVRLTPGNPPPALQQQDFVVLEDGQPQEIALFIGENAPLDLVLLLDLSGSTANKLKLIRRSTKRFVEANTTGGSHRDCHFHRSTSGDFSLNLGSGTSKQGN